MEERILLVEDERGLVVTLGDRLHSEGYRVVTAGDGKEGLDRATEEPFDLIVLDVMLPRKNGLDVCRDLRQHGVTVPILMLTARSQTVDKVLGLKLGADDYVTKPFDMHELLASDSAHAIEAIDLFVYRIGRELGSLAAALGGLDALVFTGGIGEHAAPIRARVCQDAQWLGVRLDAAANDAGGPKISADDRAVSVWVIPTDEDMMIARHTNDIVRATATVNDQS